jgi:UDP-3-O-[3-hydroxymyristoyl] N-acetylglucosamine deacetylase
LRYSVRQQRTLARSATVEGFGYWSGQDVRVKFKPAPPDSGVVFVRSDLGPAKRIPALVQHRIETPRRTTLSAGGASVEMVEHVMAALAGLWIDNCEVWVDRPELPGCDGSSLPFVQALDAAGIVLQDRPRTVMCVTETTRVGNEECWVEAQPSPSPGLHLKYRLDYGPDNPIGRQTLELEVEPIAFRRELAPARTFILKEEADWLRTRGLGARVTPRDLLVFDDNGPVDNELRFDAECVRHKALDMIGDLALAGCDIVGRFVAYRSGHRLNAELVKVLLPEARLMTANYPAAQNSASFLTQLSGRRRSA